MTNTDVTVATNAPKLLDGVRNLESIAPEIQPGCRVFVHYNGPTDQLRGVCAGMAVLQPGASPHPPHRHPEEEFLIISEGRGEIECDGVITQVSAGAVMYCAANTLHGVVNTGDVPMTFYWSKWFASPDEHL